MTKSISNMMHIPCFVQATGLFEAFKMVLYFVAGVICFVVRKVNDPLTLPFYYGSAICALIILLIGIQNLNYLREMKSKSNVIESMSFTRISKELYDGGQTAILNQEFAS